MVINLSCEKMDDNFKEYLELQRSYSPKVNNLTADVGLNTVTLHWENPSGTIAKHILVDFRDDSIYFEQMVDSVSIDSLEIKFYTMTVFTIDEFNNRSVPVSVSVFPNGEN